MNFVLINLLLCRFMRGSQRLHTGSLFTKSWLSLGWNGGSIVNGSSLTMIQCFTLAVEADPDFAEAWNSLADAGGGLVGPTFLTASQCHIRAIGADPNFVEAWNGLGCAGGGVVYGSFLTGT